jgi:hypothetical protein
LPRLVASALELCSNTQMRIVMLGISLLFISGAAAMARPRDDVMINVYRCAAHPLTRVWLDCYYGAAQPQRAALGLPPAPPAQVQLVQTPPAPGVPTDLAQRDAVIAAAARCGSVAAERPWLDCYYGAADPVRRLLGLAPAVAAPSQPSAGPHGEPDLLGHVNGKSATVSVSRMASYRFDRNGIFTVTLANGEVWQQLNGDSHVAHWAKDPGRYVVTVSTGAFKSFNLTVTGTPASYKVRRIS